MNTEEVKPAKKKRSTTQTVHFTVTGEFMTGQARDFWEEGIQDKALSFLIDSLPGLTQEQALAVCEGRMKFTGDSTIGLDLVPDTAKGPTLVEVLAKQRAEKEAAEEYAKDLEQLMRDDTVIVASHTGAREVPARRAHRHPSIPGATRLLDGWEFDDAPNPDPKKKKLSAWRELAKPVFSRSELLTPAEGVEEEIDEAEERQQHQKRRAEGVPEITSNTGWLLADGMFYPCKYGQHNDTIAVLGLNPSDDHVRIFHNDGRTWFAGDEQLWTAVQKQRVRDYCKKERIEPPYWMEDEAS